MTRTTALLLLVPVGLALFSGVEYGVGHATCSAVYGILALISGGTLVMKVVFANPPCGCVVDRGAACSVHETCDHGLSLMQDCPSCEASVCDHGTLLGIHECARCEADERGEA